ncbi:hypothetical protein F0562_006180 [Nyssa sinensis]|uniref:Histone H2A/H2B/H3 domain-containing protein n=1 Tax=Nyssa sinensis TaxID=561372 RepID=A0A5J5APX9_9ASTE|nr:hypothetical protein F0562_006180 [Nyssa sinensis]
MHAKRVTIMPKDIQLARSIRGNQGVGNLDSSGNEQQETKGMEETESVAPPPPIIESESFMPQSADTPHQFPATDVPDLVSEPSRKQLPPRLTRGIPKPTYEPKLSSKVKYPMNHYVSNHRLSESN